ncbi:hypothetical protein B296_00022958 [Ensete ventricosum]|uniref:Uncharacterized protein n=1 Tax=Ensete ventricosum TaxID=4639 RepID=A0A426Y3L0_ENSVE|nr:hypothetical protein B296_00022958 [Ensete ventricosum]
MGKKILPTPRSWRTAGLRDAVVMTLVADDCFEDRPQDDPSSPPPAVAVAFAALKLVYAWGGRSGRWCRCCLPSPPPFHTASEAVYESEGSREAPARFCSWRSLEAGILMAEGL